MSKTYHVTVATRTRDALFMTLLRDGVNMGTTSLLTVRVGQEYYTSKKEQNGHAFST